MAEPQRQEREAEDKSAHDNSVDDLHHNFPLGIIRAPRRPIQVKTHCQQAKSMDHRPWTLRNRPTSCPGLLMLVITLLAGDLAVPLRVRLGMRALIALSSPQPSDFAMVSAVYSRAIAASSGRGGIEMSHSK